MADQTMANIAEAASVLGSLLVANPKHDDYRLAREFRDTDLQACWPFGSDEELARIGRKRDAEGEESLDQISRDYERLFVGPAHLEAAPWGSVYLDPDQIVFGDSEIALRKWERERGITTKAEGSREPADHIGRMFILLAVLANERPCLVTEYLTDHLMPWAPRYFELLGSAARTGFYRCIADLGAITLGGGSEQLGIAPRSRELYS